MPTFIEAMPKHVNEFEQEVFKMSPGAKVGEEYQDGEVRASWFSSVFPAIANATLPLADDKYEALKAIGDFWKINAINWRKSGTIEMNIPADKNIQEEEDFLLEMYPPAPQTEEQPTEEA
jgi:hypothetical protein